MGRELLLSKNGKTLYRDGDLVVKVFDPSLPKSEPFNEALINTRIEGLPQLHVPAIREVAMTDEGWTVTRDYVDGRELKDLMAEHPDRMEQYLTDMLNLQLLIHSQLCPLLPTLRDKISRQILEVDDGILSDGKRFDLLTRLDNMPKHRKLCHGEFCPENIVVQEDGQMYVLDWVHAYQGNSSAETARTFLILAMEDIGMAKRYLHMFCDATYTDIRYVKSWIPIMAASQLSKRRPDEQEFLLQWTDRPED